VNPVTRPLVGTAVRLLELYKRRLSPLLPPSCRFTPTCSEYARLALIRHGLGRGSVRALLRLMRCQPLHPGGVDLP
jgi:putative membrane protein insertion efficiency factor